MLPRFITTENLWAIVKKNWVGKRFKTKTELWNAPQEDWNSIRLETLIALVDSMPGRLNAVIKANGGPTKY